VICSSEIDKIAMANAMEPIKINDVIITGLPRNDLMMKEKIKLPIDYQEICDQIEKIKGDRKMVLFAPTWRSNNEIELLDKKDMDCIEQFLIDNDEVILGVRSHYITKNVQKKTHLNLVKDRVIDFSSIVECSMLLRYVDILITDYSSIFIDFMLLNRPCFFYAPDIEEYSKTNGFIYDYQLIVGKYYTNFEEMLGNVNLALKCEFVPSEHYKFIRRLFHKYDDGRSSSRVVSAIRNMRRIDG
jgi:CDP-glycerol glycerophosphotransferase